MTHDTSTPIAAAVNEGRAGPAWRFWRSAEGVAHVEFAILMAFFFIPLIIAIHDFGKFGLEWANLRSAAIAGAHLGVQNQTFAQNTTLIEAAARADAGDPSLTVSARNFCQCPTETTESDCNTQCPDNEWNPMYFEVTVSRDIGYIITYPGVPNPYPLSVTAQMRVR